MTEVLDGTTARPAVEDSQQPLGSWSARAGAFAIDVLADSAVVTTMALLVLTAPQRGWVWWVLTGVAVVTVLAMLVNRWLLPSLTGWTIGRAVFGIRVVRGDGTAVGVWRLLLRDLAHLLDTAALFVGWLWPLWDRRRRTFADLLLRTEVREMPRPERDTRRVAAVFLAAAALTCAVAVGLSYLVVYQHEQATEEARAQIAAEGPRIVEQLLSYSADTLQEDFERAQGLATDSYRTQLVAQQQAVQQARVSTNQYWAVSSAVLSASPEQASMLLAMQGQRGSDPKDLKFITATIRAEFDKTDGQWRVGKLTVLKKPLMGAGR